MLSHEPHGIIRGCTCFFQVVILDSADVLYCPSPLCTTDIIASTDLFFTEPVEREVRTDLIYPDSLVALKMRVR